MKNLGHLMLDLETMGNKSNSAIVSIGAVEFDIETGELGREFYCVISLQSCLNKGLIINASTLYWWLLQNENARKEICAGNSKIATTLERALENFSSFINKIGGNNVQIWGNGARFDIGILEDAYVSCGYLEMPWNFRNERDVRTLVSFAPNIKEQFQFQGIEHHPIHDCKHQIKYCHAIWSVLRHKHMLE